MLINFFILPCLSNFYNLDNRGEKKMINRNRDLHIKCFDFIFIKSFLLLIKLLDVSLKLITLEKKLGRRSKTKKSYSVDR